MVGSERQLVLAVEERSLFAGSNSFSISDAFITDDCMLIATRVAKNNFFIIVFCFLVFNYRSISIDVSFVSFVARKINFFLFFLFLCVFC